MVYMVLNWTGSKMTHMAPNNVFSLRASITLDVASCTVRVLLSSSLDTILSLLYMDDFAQCIYNENHNIISDGTMIYTQMKDSPQIE